MGTPVRASLLQQVAEITVDEYRAACLIVTDDEGRLHLDLFKMGLHHRALKIDDATRQLLFNLPHDQAVADDQAAGQDRLVETILGTGKEITELKSQLQTVTAERDDLQSRLEGLTRDHDAVKTKNEGLTNKLAELQQNQPNADLPRRLEELEKSNAEMENELVTWRSGEEMWQKEVKQKDVEIQRLASELSKEKRLYKYMKDSHEKRVGDFTKDLNRKDEHLEEWKAVVHKSHEHKVGRLEHQIQSLDSDLTGAYRMFSRAQEEVVRAQEEVVRAQEEVIKLKDEMSDFRKAKNENDAVAALKFRELAELKRKAWQQELDMVVLEESYASLQQNLEQARQRISQIQLDLNEMREHAHDSRTEAEQAWAEVTRLEQERTEMQQLAEEIEQSNTALTGQNQEQRLAINSLEQDTQHFIRIMGSLTGVQLDPDSWNTAVRLVGTPVHGLDELTPFWRVDQSWGETRSISEYRPSQNSSEMLTSCFSLFATLVTSSDEVDWRNRAVQVTQCLMRELQGADEAQIYVGFLEEFANLVARLIDQGRLQNNDPLVFSIWELLACANEMLTGMLGQPTNLLEQRLGGHWVAFSRAMRAGYTHVTEEAISNLFRESEYLRAPGMGVLLDNERLTGARLYIVLDFDPNARAIRVMEGRIWSLVSEGGNFGAICFRGSDDLTVTIPLAGPKDIMWWWNSVDNMEVD